MFGYLFLLIALWTSFIGFYGAIMQKLNQQKKWEKWFL